MANKSAVPRVSKFQPNISGMDGQHMHNEILLGLPRAESVVLFPYLEYVPMPTHHVLHEAGQTITHGHFINSGLASVLNLMKDGKSVEVGLAGKEGFIGLPLIVGLSTSPTRGCGSTPAFSVRSTRQMLHHNGSVFRQPS